MRDYGVVEDDLPLRGPWSRRKDSSRPAETRPADYTEDWEAAGEGESVEEDSPLRGPWARRQEDPGPREGEGELPRTERERRPAAQEPGGGPRTASVEEAVKPDRAVAFLAPPGPEVPDARDNCPAGRRREPMQNLFTPKGIYHGIIMAEVLGSRGGRSRRRPY